MTEGSETFPQSRSVRVTRELSENSPGQYPAFDWSNRTGTNTACKAYCFEMSGWSVRPMRLLLFEPLVLSRAALYVCCRFLGGHYRTMRWLSFEWKVLRRLGKKGGRICSQLHLANTNRYICGDHLLRKQ